MDTISFFKLWVRYFLVNVNQCGFFFANLISLKASFNYFFVHCHRYKTFLLSLSFLQPQILIFIKYILNLPSRGIWHQQVLIFNEILTFINRKRKWKNVSVFFFCLNFHLFAQSDIVILFTFRTQLGKVDFVLREIIDKVKADWSCKMHWTWCRYT